jgi:hypothetical protein
MVDPTIIKWARLDTRDTYTCEVNSRGTHHLLSMNVTIGGTHGSLQWSHRSMSCVSPIVTFMSCVSPIVTGPCHMYLRLSTAHYKGVTGLSGLLAPAHYLLLHADSDCFSSDSLLSILVVMKSRCTDMVMSPVPVSVTLHVKKTQVNGADFGLWTLCVVYTRTLHRPATKSKPELIFDDMLSVLDHIFFNTVCSDMSWPPCYACGTHWTHVVCLCHVWGQFCICNHVLTSENHVVCLSHILGLCCTQHWVCAVNVEESCPLQCRGHDYRMGPMCSWSNVFWCTQHRTNVHLIRSCW